MARKQPQVLEINPPNELKFVGPFTEVVTSHLILANPSEKRVAFKVKTTAPRRYCVRPNSGFVEPSAKVDVSVMLQPLEGDGVLEKGKHKFMVQSLFAPSVVDDVEKFWHEATPSDLMDTKLRCVFDGEGSKEIEPAAPPSVEVPSSKPDELRALTEECKRLQDENARLKQISQQTEQPDIFVPTMSEVNLGDSDEEAGGVEALKVMPKKQQEMVICVCVLAFIIGIALGYFLF